MDASVSGLAGRGAVRAAPTSPPKKTPTGTPATLWGGLAQRIAESATAWWQVVTESPEADYQQLSQAGDEAAYRTLLDAYGSTRSLGSLFQLAFLLESVGFYHDARYLTDRLLERGGRGDLRIEDKVFFALAQIKTGEYAKGIDGLKELESLLTGEALFQVKTALAGAYLELMMYEEVLQELLPLYSQQPDNLQIKLMLYQTYKKLGREREAQKIRERMSLAALASMFQERSFTPFSGDGESMVIYAQLLLENCRYEEAEALLTASLQNGISGKYLQGVIGRLARSYQKQEDLTKLEALAEQAKEHGFMEGYYQIMGMISLSRSVDPKIGREEQARFAAEATRYIQDGEQLELERIASFPSAINLLGLAYSELCINNFLSDDVFSALLEGAKKLPPGATRIREQIALVELRKVLHLAAASDQPQRLGGTIVQHLPLSEFPGSSAGPVHQADAPELTDLLSLPPIGELPYLVRDREKFYRQITDIAGRFDRFKGRDLSKLPAQELIYLAAQVTQDMVGTYGEAPAADETCTPLEVKSARGDYNEAVCRHYTIIFIAVFNALKEINPALASYHAFSGFSRFHTFPMVATVRKEGGESRLIFTALDPTADDSTPEFDDRLEVPPGQFGLFELIDQAISRGDKKEALSLLFGNFTRAEKDPRLLVRLRTKIKRMGLSRQELSEFRQRYLQPALARAEAAGQREEGALVFMLLQLFNAEVELALGNYRLALPLFSSLMATYDQSSEMVQGYIEALAGLGRWSEIGRIAEQMPLSEPGHSFPVRIRNGRIFSPLLRFTNGELFLEIGEDSFPIKGGKAEIALPRELRQFRKELEGATFRVRVGEGQVTDDFYENTP